LFLSTRLSPLILTLFSLRSLMLNTRLHLLIFLLYYFLYIPHSYLFYLWLSLVPCASPFSYFKHFHLNI
jgi:uncharacterized membrane protein YccC